MKKWSGNYRSRSHDYTSRCLYHITLMKAKETEPFGRLAGDCNIPVGSYHSPFIIASRTGLAIKSALRSLPEIHPALKLYQYALMPDHLHIILSVESELDEPLGRKIAIFKNAANKFAGSQHLFELGFNDQILYRSRRLDDIYKYLRENPYRLAVRRAHPEYFRRVNCITIGGRKFSAYGNMDLLQNPFKEQVVVHRRDDEAIRKANFERWLYTAVNGGVLVSPFISKAEKEIRRIAEENSSRIILITNEGFGERGKPAGHDFEQCESGNLLILCPVEPMLPAELSRNVCLEMNDMAKSIAGLSQSREGMSAR